MTKNTPFYNLHEKAGARMVPFAGYNLPLEYSGVISEHINVRNNVGIFDISHMGEICVTGKNAASYLQKVTTNDIYKLKPGKVQYTCFPNGKGGIVDDLLIYQLDEDKYMAVVNAANIEKDMDFMVAHNSLKADIEDLSGSTAQLALQGPKAVDIMQAVSNSDISGMKSFRFVVGNIGDVDNVTISRTGYTGEDGFELYFNPQKAEAVWDMLNKAGEKYNLKPIGLAARDTLRLEAALCLYGNDIDDTTSPLEAGLDWIVKFNENNDFIDKDVFWQQKTNGVSKKLIGFEMIDRGIPRHGYEILDKESNDIGWVTSGTMSPILKKGIGLGYVKPGYADTGKEIYIRVRKKILKAKTVQTPFINQ
jgi:aminomethyltransferase